MQVQRTNWDSEHMWIIWGMTSLSGTRCHPQPLMYFVSNQFLVDGLEVVVLFHLALEYQGYSNKSRGDQRGGMHTNERLHVKLITIGSNGPYGRRKRSDWNPSTSVWCEGIGKNFFAFFWREWNLSCDTFFCFFGPHFGKIWVFLCEVIFFMYFFLRF